MLESKFYKARHAIITRRDLLHAGAALALGLKAGCARSAATGPTAIINTIPIRSSQELDRSIMFSMAESLFSHMNTQELQEITDNLVDWIEQYDPQIERIVRPIAFEALGSVVSIPPPNNIFERFSDNLHDLERRAITSFGTGFTTLKINQKQEILSNAIKESTTGLESLLHAAHMHIGATLLFIYSVSTDAHNRCYGASINPRTCRGLVAPARPPLLELEPT